MALDKFQPYLFVSAGEQSNKYLTPSYSGDIAQFQAQRAQYFTGLTVRIDPIQEGTGDPAPDNIRPISGRTGLTVTRAGKNLLPPIDATQTINGITWTKNADGSVTLSGTATANSVYDFGRNSLILPKGTYTTKDNTIGNVLVTVFHIVNGTASVLLSGGGTFTLSQAEAVFVRYYIASGNTVAATIYPQIEVGTSATAYEPYTAQTYPITWETEAGTIYGGTLDVVSGVLTVTHAYWTKNTATMCNGEYYPGWRDCGVKQIIGKFNAVFNFLLGNVGTVLGINTTGTLDIAYMPKDSYNQLNETQWKELAIDVEFVLPLATPQTYQLTPTEVRTIAGFNQIYSDAGPVIDIKF